MFQMTVEDFSSITGRGVVATGLVESGSVRVGDMVKLMRLDEEIGVFEVKGVQDEDNGMVESANSGNHVGILLGAKNALKFARGDILKSQ